MSDSIFTLVLTNESQRHWPANYCVQCQLGHTGLQELQDRGAQNIGKIEDRVLAVVVIITVTKTFNYPFQDKYFLLLSQILLLC